METVMFGDGDDAGHCSSWLTAQKFRDSTTEERATYRSWMRGMVALYCALLLISGIAIAGYSKVGQTHFSNLSARNIAASSRTN
jgi:hypothetical protein